MMAMSVCGIVLTAIGSTLDSIAENCGTTATSVGSVFVARGIGAIVGAFASAKIYAPPTKGNNVMIGTMAILTGLLLYLPFVTDIYSLHAVFAGLGFCTAVTDTGCQIMTRKTHESQAGPWLGANTVVFGVAGALVPVVELITTDLLSMYLIFSTVTVMTTVLLLSLPHPESDEVKPYLPMKVVKKSKDTKTVDSRIETYYINEAVIGSTIFWLIGGKVLCSSYVEDYVADSGVVSTSDEAWSLMVVWIFIALGRFVGLFDLIRLNKMGSKGINLLYPNTYLWMGCGALGGALIFFWQNSSTAFWASLVLYGFGNGPCVGYMYDLNNRLTASTEKGMSVVMLGLNLGASVVPYVATVVWDYTDYSYHIFPLMIFVTMIIPIPLMASTKLINDIDAISKESY